MVPTHACANSFSLALPNAAGILWTRLLRKQTHKAFPYPFGLPVGDSPRIFVAQDAQPRKHGKQLIVGEQTAMGQTLGVSTWRSSTTTAPPGFNAATTFGAIARIGS